jgi:hypothetical protein
MINHRSDTWWPGYREVRFLIESQNQDRRFPGLDLKTSSSSLVIWASKWWLGLGLKTIRASICRLRHKIDGGRSARNKRRDLMACFAWKQVALGFPTLASRLTDARWREVHVTSTRRLHRIEAEDGRVDMTGYVGPFYLKIIVFYVLGTKGNLIF